MVDLVEILLRVTLMGTLVFQAYRWGYRRGYERCKDDESESRSKLHCLRRAVSRFN